uniref:KH domain-containing, RNA-binding, signal transduction-associated protein 2-like n=1 Tax=Hirondellea gigas TaxID=1518452 RepID=A0A6A7GBP3_9CRUS
MMQAAPPSILSPTIPVGGGVVGLLEMPPPPCTPVYVDPSPPTPPPPCGDGGAGDALHAERMEYIRQLVQERDNLATTDGCDVAKRLVEQELERVQSGRRSDEKRSVEVTKEKSIKVTVKVQVPVREHPKFNFVGKLLGPKGNSLKRLQEETMTKMAILGRGSFRDKAKEEELRKNPDPKYSHLHEELHVEVTAHAPPAEAYARIAYALTEIRRYLVPDHNDEIRQEQMREMQILGGRNGAVLLPIDGLGTPVPATNGVTGDAHTDGSGSLSPPSSLSPPPATATPTAVKLPQPHATALTQPPPPPHSAPGAVAPPMHAANFLAASHPAMRGLTRAQMGLLATAPSYLGSMPNIAASPAMAPGAMIGRYPTMLPLGSIAMPTSQLRSMPLAYEDFADMPTLQHSELDQSFSNVYDADKSKDAALKAAGAQMMRGRYRHEPYRRIINVPS